MTWRDTFLAAWAAVHAHRLRSALTMLGILIGISAVVLTVGIGEGARAEVRASIDALGTNLLVISPGSSTDSSGTRGGFGTASTLTESDAVALASSGAAPDIESVAPLSSTSASLVAGDTNWTTELTGTTEAWQTIRSRDVTTGRFIDADDDATAAAVVVLGPSTAMELFETTDAVGRTVATNGLQLEVIGVLESVDAADTNTDDVAIVPLSTYARRLVGGADRSAVDNVYVKATDDDTLSAAYQQAENLLLNLHGITDPDDADFTIATEESILRAATDVDDTLTVMLGGIAIISLLVGGIGVMNIMLVSVTERINEIGLRKALGARPRFIRRQFLMEASILGLLGGIAGVAVGLAGEDLIPRYTDTDVIVSLPASAAAIVVAVAVGVIFGVYPASRAARLTPIEALRSE